VSHRTRDRMNCSETERSNDMWVRFWAFSSSLPESTDLSSGPPFQQSLARCLQVWERER
jgi:hypothetical protein